jgi:hypothetical protein
MFGDGFDRILRTGGNKATGRWKERGDEVLVPPENHYQAYSWNLPYRKATRSSAGKALMISLQAHSLPPV